MSYDLYFIPKAEGQTWDDALEAAEEVEDYGPPLDSQTWQQILAVAHETFPGIEDLSTADRNELDHEASGMQLTAAEKQAGIGVPYWHDSEAIAAEVVRSIYKLGNALQTATGLQGYDPQTGMPVHLDSVDLAIEAYKIGVSALR